MHDMHIPNDEIPMEIIVDNSMHRLDFEKIEFEKENVGTVLRNENLPFPLNNQGHGFEWLYTIPSSDALASWHYSNPTNPMSIRVE